ncbi:uncharacterized protein CLV88_10739 [Shimia abyssi]|uniref:HD domain-containing protein n=2 Tax=Shimia abyssi TaxID=1662395 RepID=A0A2P8FBI8_9RHOB|nr:uncharacterized protein CLV88_10739 [Shimia abyssi]
MSQDAAHDLAHLDRVWTNASRIADTETDVNLTVLVSAAYLHDLVNLPKDAPNRATASHLAAQEATPILQRLGLSAADITAAQHAITAHSFSAGILPETIEAKILRDADRLDALGAIGIARCFAVSAKLDRAFYDPDDPFAMSRAPDDGQFAMDHWPIKLLRLPEDMLTTTGRAIAKERLATMVQFAQAWATEINAPFPRNWFSPE